MAVTFQSYSSTHSASTTSLTITKPSGTVDGDLLIAHICITALTDTVTAPAGWTTIQDTANDNDANGGHRTYTFYKVASSEGTDYSFTISGGGSQAQGAISRLDGQSASSPIATSSENAVNSDTTTITGATVTPVNSNSFLLFCSSTGPRAGSDNSASGYAIATSDPSWTEGYDLGDTNQASIFMAYATRPEITATGAATATLAASNKNITHIIVINANLQVLVTIGNLVLNGLAVVIALSQTVAVPVQSLSLTGPTIVASVDTHAVISNQDKNSASATNQAKNSASNVLNVDKNSATNVLNLDKS